MRTKKRAGILLYAILYIILYCVVIADYADFIFALNEAEEAYYRGAVGVQFLACNIVCRFVITVSRSLIVVLFILKREKIIAKSV